MALLPLKTKSALISDLISYIRSRQPKADITPGSIMRDLLVESPAELIYNSQVLAEFISKLNNFRDLYELLRDQTYKAQVASGLGIDLTNVETIISDTISNYAANFAMIRKAGQKATTVVTFSSATRPTAGFTIPAGTAIQTVSVSNALIFKTTADAIMPSSPPSTYVNPENGQWEVQVSAEAEAEGPQYNVAANTLTSFKETGAAPTGVTVTNRVSALGGLNQETDAELLDRISYAYRGNFSGTPASILSAVLGLNYIGDAEIVYQLNDVDRIREASYEVDIWVSTFNRTAATTEVAMGGDPYIRIPNAPVQAVTQVVDLDAISPYVFTPNMYRFEQDASSTYRYSVNALDKITFTEITPIRSITGTTVKLALPLSGGVSTPFIDKSPGNPVSPAGRLTVYINSVPDGGWIYSSSGDTIEKTFPLTVPTGAYTVKQTPIAGDGVRIQYIYNSRIRDTQTFITAESRLFLGQDLLVREARAVPIVIEVTIQSDNTRSSGEIEADISAVFQKDIVTLKLSQEINVSRLIQLALSVAGVIDVRVDKLYRTDGPVAAGDIQLSRFEYATINNITTRVVTTRVIV